MWNEITNARDLADFMDKVCFFHDSCIKELKYISGAYVGEALGMYPVNDRRILRLIIQRQFKDISMLEMEFEGLKFLKLFPADGTYTCEILDSTMLFKDGYIYWCDCGGLSEEELADYTGTILCASKFRWRPIHGCMGKEEFYTAAK